MHGFSFEILAARSHLDSDFFVFLQKFSVGKLDSRPQKVYTRQEHVGAFVVAKEPIRGIEVLLLVLVFIRPFEVEPDAFHVAVRVHGGLNVDVSHSAFADIGAVEKVQVGFFTCEVIQNVIRDDALACWHLTTFVKQLIAGEIGSIDLVGSDVAYENRFHVFDLVQAFFRFPAASSEFTSVQ